MRRKEPGGMNRWDLAQLADDGATVTDNGAVELHEQHLPKTACRIAVRQPAAQYALPCA